MTEEETNTITINKKQMWKYSTFLLLGVFLIGGFFTLTGNENSGSVGNVIDVGGGPGEIVEVNTIIQGFRYNPDTIIIKEGSKVRLTIQNKDNVVHGLHLPQFGILDSQAPLNTKTVEFIAVNSPTNGQAVPTCSLEHGETLTFNII